MQASWVRETTSTTGTGTINLGGAASGFLAFSDAFVSGDVVPYVIEDGNNRETGIGTLSSGLPWTLSRDQVLEKLESGVFSQWPATGINLSGSATVAIAPASQSSLDPFKTYLHSASVYDLGDLIANEGLVNTGVTADRLHLYPVLLLRPRKIGSLMCNVATADPAATISRVGIYKPDSAGMPKTLIAEASVDVTSTGVKETSLGSAQYLNPGVYYMAFATDGAPSMYALALGSIHSNGLGSDTWARPYYGYVTLSSWSGLPSTISALSQISATSAPMVGWRP